MKHFHRIQEHIFAQIEALLKGGSTVPVDITMRFDMMIRYLKAWVKYLGEERACRMMRSRLGWFVRGLRFSSKFRESIKHLSSEKEAVQLIDLYQEHLRHA
jgi:tRNA-dihydrouridine synthase B